MLDTLVHEGLNYGIVGRVVGAPFAVLLAEELFAHSDRGSQYASADEQAWWRRPRCAAV
jgi:hypothetical protein